jgi:hypothetical protein
MPRDAMSILAYSFRRVSSEVQCMIVAGTKVSSASVSLESGKALSRGVVRVRSGGGGRGCECVGTCGEDLLRLRKDRVESSFAGPRMGVGGIDDGGKMRQLRSCRASASLTVFRGGGTREKLITRPRRGGGRVLSSLTEVSRAEGNDCLELERDALWVRFCGDFVDEYAESRRDWLEWELWRLAGLMEDGVELGSGLGITSMVMVEVSSVCW